MVTQKWATNVVNGQTVLTATEVGGSVTFTFERACTRAVLWSNLTENRREKRREPAETRFSTAVRR